MRILIWYNLIQPTVFFGVLKSFVITFKPLGPAGLDAHDQTSESGRDTALDTLLTEARDREGYRRDGKREKLRKKPLMSWWKK